MTDFSSVAIIKNNSQKAFEIIKLFRYIYNRSIEVQELVVLYNTDNAFKSEVDHLFTSSQLLELVEMIGGVNTLQQSWFTNHKSPIGIDGTALE